MKHKCRRTLGFTCYNAQAWRLSACTYELYNIFMPNLPASSKRSTKTLKQQIHAKDKKFLFQKIILGKKVKLFLTLNLVQEKNLQHNWKNNYCSYEYDKPHYKDLLGKLFLHLRIYTFGLKDFNSHILTTICTSVPGSLKIEVLNRDKHKISIRAQVINLQITIWPRSNFAPKLQMFRINFPDISPIIRYFQMIGMTFHPSILRFTCGRWWAMTGPTLPLHNNQWKVNQECTSHSISKWAAHPIKVFKMHIKSKLTSWNSTSSFKTSFSSAALSCSVSCQL